MSSDSGKPSSGGPQMPFSPQDAMAFMQRIWNPFGVSMPGFPSASPPSAHADAPAQGAPASMGALPGMLPFPNPAAMFAALDPMEVERKIGELKVIENWLVMSLNMMQMSIKTLELQKASLEALRGSSPPNSREGSSRGR
jgi:hypothetical protein